MKSIFSFFLLVLYVWSYGHAVGSHNVVFEMHNHQHFHQEKAHDQEHPQGDHQHFDHGDHVDYSLIDLIFCALTDYGHFLWDIEHGEHGIHYSLGLSSNDLIKNLDSGIEPISSQLFFKDFVFQCRRVLFLKKSELNYTFDYGLFNIDLILDSPFRGPPISC